MGKSMREPPLEQGLPQGREFDLATILDDDVKQGSTITFQLTNQVATDNLDVTTICLFTSQTRKPPTKTEFVLVCAQIATIKCPALQKL